MNLNKHIEFFNPSEVQAPIHVIGVGALGSRIAELLVRLGIPELHIWDFDTVDAHNITNQIYYDCQIGQKKTEALADILSDINPHVNVIVHEEYKEQNLNGYVFLSVDNIDLRRHIVTTNLKNPYIKAVFDMRMRLTDAQSYGADWSDEQSKQALLNSMQFTSEEAKDATPVSACGTTLSVTPTVFCITAYTISNFINFTQGKELKSVILIDAFTFNTNAF